MSDTSEAALSHGYSWQVRIKVGGVDFTSPGCETKQEAQALSHAARNKDDVQSVEVERI